MDEFSEMAGPDACRSPRLFESPLLDRLSRVNHLVPLLLYLPVVVLLVYFGLYRSGWPATAAGLVAGYIVWTLLEYFGHRFVFHADFPGKLGARIHYLIHGVHHDHPGDPLRLVMPPLLSIPIMGIGFVVLRLACGPDMVLPVWAGFIAGYVGYDMVHYHVHHTLPRTRIGQTMKRRHMLHHFRDDAVSFGVSAPWWDLVFGTSGRRES